MESLEINKIYQGNAPEIISKIKKESISVSVWSPPYFVGKEYEKHLDYENWLKLLEDTIKSHYPVLKPGGFMVINIADILCFSDESIPKFQSNNERLRKVKISKEDVLKAMKENPGYNRNKLAKLLGCSEQTIDRRLNGNNIRGGKYNTMTRVHLTGSFLEKFAYDSGLYLYDRRIWKKDAAWVNSKWHNSSYRSVDEFEYLYIFWKPGETLINKNKFSKDELKNWASRGVWEISSVRANDDHEAKFPIELPKRIIKLFSEEGDTILDCFIGSGTSALAAIETKRNYIGIELKKEYVKLSNQNIKAVSEKKLQAHLF